MQCARLFFSLLFQYQVLAAGAYATAQEAGHVSQVAAEGGHAVGFQAAAGNAAQVVVDGGGRHPCASLLVGGRLVVLVEILYGRRQHLIQLVMLHDVPHLIGVEPPFHPVLRHHGVGLAVECLVVGFVGGVYGGCQVHADEAAAARGVGQHAQLVGGGDERGIALELLDVLAVGAFDLHAGQGDDVLQETLLQLG